MSIYTLSLSPWTSVPSSSPDLRWGSAKYFFIMYQNRNPWGKLAWYSCRLLIWQKWLYVIFFHLLWPFCFSFIDISPHHNRLSCCSQRGHLSSTLSGLKSSSLVVCNHTHCHRRRPTIPDSSSAAVLHLTLTFDLCTGEATERKVSLFDSRCYYCCKFQLIENKPPHLNWILSNISWPKDPYILFRGHPLYSHKKASFTIGNIKVFSCNSVALFSDSTWQ